MAFVAVTLGLAAAAAVAAGGSSITIVAPSRVVGNGPFNVKVTTVNVKPYNTFVLTLAPGGHCASSALASYRSERENLIREVIFANYGRLRFSHLAQPYGPSRTQALCGYMYASTDLSLPNIVVTHRFTVAG